MPISDLFASSRRVLRRLFGRSRRAALASLLVPLGSVGATSVQAAPYVTPPAAFPTPVFSIRVTDMERVAGDAEQDAFRVELEALNWTYSNANALLMSANVGTSAVDGTRPFIAGASIDPNGRGGAAGGSDIGAGAYDPIAIHNGRGRGDVSGALSDWQPKAVSPTFVQWDNFTGPAGQPTFFGTSLRGSQLSPSTPADYVPGFGKDALGDTAIDGGPAPYTPPSPGGGEPSWEINVADGFVLDIDDWDPGEVFSLNWQLASTFFGSGGDGYFTALGRAGDDYYSALYGFGVMSLVRVDPSIGAPATNLPGAVFTDTAGFDQSPFSFYDTVYEIPNPAEFGLEVGAALTAPFLNPADNVFNVGTNTQVVPEPGSVLLVGSGLMGFAGVVGRRRRS